MMPRGFNVHYARDVKKAYRGKDVRGISADGKRLLVNQQQDVKISALTLRVESMALTTSTPSKPMADRFVLTLSMDTTGTSLKRMVSVSVIYGITMPEASV